MIPTILSVAYLLTDAHLGTWQLSALQTFAQMAWGILDRMVTGWWLENNHFLEVNHLFLWAMASEGT